MHISIHDFFYIFLLSCHSKLNNNNNTWTLPAQKNLFLVLQFVSVSFFISTKIFERLAHVVEIIMKQNFDEGTRVVYYSPSKNSATLYLQISAVMDTITESIIRIRISTLHKENESSS